MNCFKSTFEDEEKIQSWIEKKTLVVFNFFRKVIVFENFKVNSSKKKKKNGTLKVNRKKFVRRKSFSFYFLGKFEKEQSITQ